MIPRWTIGILGLWLVGEVVGQIGMHLPGEGILYPRESQIRETRRLDGIWSFMLDTKDQEGVRNQWFNGDLDLMEGSMLMPVPSSYNDMTASAEVRDHVGLVWYQRTFFVPLSWRKQNFRVWLRFGSVNYFAQVWVNGKKVMEHEIGHLPFKGEITSLLNFGEENKLTVAVDNILGTETIPQGRLSQVPTMNGPKTVQRYSFDFYNYAGIHRSVHLYTTPQVYIDDIDLHSEFEGEKVYLSYNLFYKGASSSDTINSTLVLVEKEGCTVCFETCIVENGQGNVSGRIQIDKVNHWWPYLMHPNPGYLYTVQLYLHSEETGVTDRYSMPFGIRSLRWDNNSVYINDKPIYIRGFGRHEDADIRGKGLDLPTIVKDHNLLSWIGANAYRTSHYPYSEELMDVAESLGFMIIDESPSVDTENFTQILLEKHKIAMAEMINRDKNRACVIMWSVSNEPRTNVASAGPYFGSVVSYTRTLDSTRPITAVLNRWYTVDHARLNAWSLYYMIIYQERELNPCFPVVLFNIGSLVDYVRQLDPFRPITAVIAQPFTSDHAGQFMDVICFNRYNGWYSEPGQLESIQLAVESEAQNWREKHKKPVIMSEYGADTYPGLHSLPDNIWTEEYQTALLSEHFKAFDNLRKKGWFIGEMIWNFADFKTDQAITRVGGNKKGIFTRQREPKAAAFLVRERNYQLASQLDGVQLPTDLRRYTAFPHRNEL